MYAHVRPDQPAHSGIAKDAKFLRADNEDSDQTARMRRLIWVFAGPRISKGTFSDVAGRFIGFSLDA